MTPKIKLSQWHELFNNILEVVGEVHFDKKIIPLSDTQTTILYTATLKAKIDPDGIFDWLIS